jgi:hypothetical protein
MVYADLHVHTDHSDGQLRLDEVPAAARRAGVRVVAVTDHDRVHPDLAAPVVEFPGGRAVDPDPDPDPERGEGRGRNDRTAGGGPTPVTVVRGIELRVDAGDQRVDLLGYGLERTPEVEAEVERIQRDRRERGRAIIECVEDRLGIDLDLEPRDGLGRPHVARAVERHPDTDLDYDDAFAELIGGDCPCFVARDVPTFETGRRILADACGVVGLAHPLRYPDPGSALALTAGLDAVELSYPYGREVDLGPVEAAIEEGDLLTIGGSDAHDDRLGLAGLDAQAYRRVAAAIR